MRIVMAAGSEGGYALAAALAASGVEAELTEDGPGETPAQALAAALIETERLLEHERPAVAVAVGTGDSPLALALAASKLGIPLAACLPAVPATDEAAEWRILSELAEERLDLGSGPEALAERLLAWTEADR